jgi:hypothetical protein
MKIAPTHTNLNMKMSETSYLDEADFRISHALSLHIFIYDHKQNPSHAKNTDKQLDITIINPLHNPKKISAFKKGNESHKFLYKLH